MTEDGWIPSGSKQGWEAGAGGAGLEAVDTGSLHHKKIDTAQKDQQDHHNPSSSGAPRVVLGRKERRGKTRQ